VQSCHQKIKVSLPDYIPGKKSQMATEQTLQKDLQIGHGRPYSTHELIALCELTYIRYQQMSFTDDPLISAKRRTLEAVNHLADERSCLETSVQCRWHDGSFYR
jgi:hypothetical protein